jgi:hypothetical protein
MEQPSIDEIVVIKNNETIEIYMDDEIMEENRNVQTKTNKNLENELEEQMKKKLATTWKIIFVLEFLLCQ